MPTITTTARASVRPPRRAVIAADARWFPPVLVGASTLGELATRAETARSVLAILDRLETDDYLEFVRAYYGEALAVAGDAWRYADLLTVLFAAARVCRPRRYLEVGVRRGRSMAMIAAAAPGCDVIGIDSWIPGYAGMENPGASFVRAQMAALGHRGRLELVGESSHTALPRLFARAPSLELDLVTIDGDHSEWGAERDLRDVLPHLAPGGVLVFDDVRHPAHPYLADVWRRTAGSDARLSTWTYDDLGFGVAVAVRTR